ncbi:MAG: hypothetical protein M0007_02590, partial [Actinomycetota bacterium]|nr:hypothetical protein [Actinomycetota bacterium]
MAHTAHTAHVAHTVPTDPFCRRTYGHPCYSPSELRTAYGVAALTSAGDTGAGQTIVIVDSFGSPDIRSDLQRFDAAHGLPPPPSFTVDAPLGTVPFDGSSLPMIVWAEETSLDVEWAHAMAPGAGLVLLTSPVAETGGTTGLPQFLQLEQYADAGGWYMAAGRLILSEPSASPTVRAISALFEYERALHCYRES